MIVARLVPYGNKKKNTCMYSASETYWSGEVCVREVFCCGVLSF